MFNRFSDNGYGLVLSVHQACGTGERSHLIGVPGAQLVVAKLRPDLIPLLYLDDMSQRTR